MARSGALGGTLGRGVSYSLVYVLVGQRVRYVCARVWLYFWLARRGPRFGLYVRFEEPCRL